MIRIVRAPTDHFMVGNTRQEYLEEEIHPRRDMDTVAAAVARLLADEVRYPRGLEIVVLPRTPAPVHGMDCGDVLALTFWTEPARIFLLPRNVRQDADDFREYIRGALALAKRVAAARDTPAERRDVLTRWINRWEAEPNTVDPVTYTTRTLKHEVGHLWHFARCRRRHMGPAGVSKWLSSEYQAICEQRAAASGILELPEARDPSEMIAEDALLSWRHPLALNKYTMVGDLVLPDLVERGRRIVAEKLMTTRGERPSPSRHVSDEAVRRLSRLSPEELDAEAARIAERLAKNEAGVRTLARSSTRVTKARKLRTSEKGAARYSSKGSSRKGRVLKPGRGRSQAKAKKVAKRKP